MKASAKDLRFHAKQLLETVKRGEEVVITYRGLPCAKLVPIENKDETQEDELFGLWKDYKEIENPTEYVRKLRKGRL